jgi:hypothetical protein
MSSVSPIIAIVLALGAIEGLAYWWMNPPPAATGEPVLAYRPSRSVGVSPTSEMPKATDKELSVVRGRLSEKEMSEQDESAPTAPDSSSSTAHRSPITDHFSTAHAVLSAEALAKEDGDKSAGCVNPALPVPTDHSPTFTPLPALYRQAAPMLRCSGGEVLRVDTADDNLTLHLAWFEWDGTDTGSVLEAFRHMPEACMGSIGMKLVSKEKPIPYTVGLALRAGPLAANGAESQATGIVDRRSEIVDDPAFSSDPKSTIHDPQPARSGDGRRQSTISLLFDHTIFREPGASGLVPPVHSFRAVWVAGMHQADARRGIGGRELDRLRGIRLKAAATRYRPPRACVVQGTVRGALSADAAWRAFEQHMLRDLTLQR